MALGPRLVIVGTDTDVGKTVVSALVVQGLGAHYWKPVQSGLEEGGDSGRVQRLLALPPERVLPVPVRAGRQERDRDQREDPRPAMG